MEIVVILVLVEQARQEIRGEGDEESLRTSEGERRGQAGVMQGSSSPDWPASPTHVGDDGQVRQGLQDVEPHADVLGALGHRPAVLAHKLVRVQADLGPVVEEGEERRQGERRHKDGDEAELEHCSAKKDAADRLKLPS